MRLTRKQLLLVLPAVAGVSVIGFLYARRSSQPRQTEPQHATSIEQAASADYADPAVCASCHDQIARTFGLTGMARSFSKPRPADFKGPNRFYHDASDRHYTMVERGGTFYQRRHQIGFDGKETNVVELTADYVVGSGNHAQTFLHRNPDGQLAEMPVSWYAERGGYWAMSPGYDRSAHLDFRRVIDTGCMSCHNGYPRGAAGELPEGIDCQRCHGPGQSHVDRIKAGDLDAALRAIVNPGKLDRERQLETCMQCHLEPTSSPLPFQIRRYEYPPFSYAPGKTLSDYLIYFDHAPGSGRDDKFEIAGGAYRLRKSACFQRSQMTCVTCHDPHDIPRGVKAVQHYVTACQSCHEGAHSKGGVPRVQGVSADATCLDCHMPKRRTEDAVHVVMTDHFIQSRRALGHLLAPRKESENFERGSYRGEVVLYYPATLLPTSDNELYLALAQVQDGSNLTAGIPRLEQAIARFKPQRPNFYYELARAYAKRSNYDAAVRWSEEALRRDGSFVPALKEVSGAAQAMGNFAQAAQALERAVALRPSDGDAFADLGNTYLQQNRVDDAQKALARALTIDPNLPRAHNTMGLAALKKNDANIAEDHFRAAIRSQPDLAEAHNNLGNVVAGRKAYAEAGYHFEKAIRSDPTYAQAHHSYGVVLALAGEFAKAVSPLRTALKLDPRLAQAHIDLADVLATMGRTAEATHEYELAIQTSSDPDVRAAAVAALGALKKTK